MAGSRETHQETPRRGTDLPAAPRDLWITAEGGRLLDSAGRPLILRAANWYGLEAHPWLAGTRQRSYRSRDVRHNGARVFQKGILEDIRDMGFNALRIPICHDIADPAWSTAANPGMVDAAYNPDFVDPGTGRPVPALAMLTLVAQHCRSLGLRVILDMHCAEPNYHNVHGQTRLWYTTEFPDSPAGSPHHTGRTDGDPGGTVGRNEAGFFEAWTALARHFADNSAVCAFDLVNEPFWATWEAGDIRPSHNLRFLYERLGNRLHAVNPNLFLWLEGPADAGHDPATGRVERFASTPRYTNLPELGAPWWGSMWSANLRLAGRLPPGIRLTGKFGYSPHEYGAESGLPYFAPAARSASGATMPLAETLRAVWDAQWGYLARQDIAPVWIGEYASPMTSAARSGYTPEMAALDAEWLPTLAAYCRDLRIGHAYFPVNANEAEPENGWFYGHDWHGYTGVNTLRQALFRPMLRPRPGPGPA